MEITAITAALLNIGLSILANLATDPVKNLLHKFSRSKELEEVPLKDLFIKAFYQSLDYHDAHYDETAQKDVECIRAAVKKNESKLLAIISRRTDATDRFLSSLKSGDFQRALAGEVVNEFSLNLQGRWDLMVGILSDCFRFYRTAFFNLMSEKQGLQAILLECLKIESILDLLKKVDSQMVTRKDFDDLKRIFYTHYYAQHPEDHKKLEDYDNYIKNKFQYIELRGFSPRVSGKEILMKLEDIFVPLEIKPDRERSRISPESHQDEIIPESTDKTPSVEDIIRVLLSDNVVILGDPGSGKSTLLKYLARLAAGNRCSDHPFGCIIPVYFRIPEFALYLKNHGKNLYEFITDHFDRQYSNLFKEGFAYSNLLLFMDGLDEVIETPLRIRVTEQVEDLMARYPYNHYVVTSRVVGYQESRLGAGFKHFGLQPFGKKQIATFCGQWYRAIAAHMGHDDKHAQEQADSLNESISRNPSVTKLASNPLLMTIIALIHHRGKKLPNKRIELYDICTETFLEHWVNLRRQLGLNETSQLKDKNEIIEIMAPIAFKIHDTKPDGLITGDEFKEAFTRQYQSIYTSAPMEKVKNEYKEFLQFLRQEAGFFYEKGENDQGQPLFGFIHLTFEEYFAALHLMGQWMEGKLDFKKYIFEPRWAEIIRLAAAQMRFAIKGQVGRGKAAEFVRDLLAVDDLFPEAYRPLQLVCLVLADDVSITEEIQSKVLDKIIKAFQTAPSEVLVDSFSRLLKELFSSDGKEVYIERIKKELLSTSNQTLRDNLVRVLMENSGEESIRKFLMGLVEKPGEYAEICRTIFSIRWMNYPIQHLSSFQNSFLDFLKTFPFTQAPELAKSIIEAFLTIITKNFFFGLSKTNWKYIKVSFDSLYSTAVFEPLFFKMLENCIRLSINGWINKTDFMEFLKKYPGNLASTNLHDLLEKGKIEISFLPSLITPVELKNLSGCLIFKSYGKGHE